MKLYTEKELRKAIGKSRLRNGFVDGVSSLKYTIDEVLEQSLPIELPSDEEIEHKSIEISPITSNYARKVSKKYFKSGAKWMKEQILKQNK